MPRQTSYSARRTAGVVVDRTCSFVLFSFGGLRLVIADRPLMWGFLKSPVTSMLPGQRERLWSKVSEQHANCTPCFVRSQYKKRSVALPFVEKHGRRRRHC